MQKERLNLHVIAWIDLYNDIFFVVLGDGIYGRLHGCEVAKPIKIDDDNAEADGSYPHLVVVLVCGT